MIHRVLLGLVIYAASAVPLNARTPTVAAPPHDLHVTTTRMVIDGTSIVARVRMFRDDLQKALKRPVNDSASSRAAVAAYFAQHVLLTAAGRALSGKILESGGEMDGDQPVWWVIAEWRTAQPVTTLGVRVHLMFDAFSDQQNTVLVARNPGDQRRGLYFQAGDRAEQVLKF